MITTTTIKRVALVVSFFIVAAAVLAKSPGASTPTQNKSPSTHSTQDDSFWTKKGQQNLSADIARLDAAGAQLKTNGLIIKSHTGGWGSDAYSLNLTLGSHNIREAEFMANHMCNGFFVGGVLHRVAGRPWNVRVHLVDGSVAAQCEIKSVKQL